MGEKVIQLLQMVTTTEGYVDTITQFGSIQPYDILHGIAFILYNLVLEAVCVLVKTVNRKSILLP